MSARDTQTKLVAIFIVLVVAVTAWVAWPARRAFAIQDSEDKPNPFGIATGQIARLSVFNSSDRRECFIEWTYVDGEGRTVARTPEPHLIPPGRFVSFDLDGDSLGQTRDGFGRVQVQAVVRSVGNPNDKNLHVSVELFDKATGRTTSFITGGGMRGFSPPPNSD